MDEEIQGVETTETETPTPDSPQGEQETPAESPVETQDNRDWEGYARRLESENKDFKSMFKERASVEAAPAPTESKVAPEQQEAIDLLRNIMREEITGILSPIQQQLQSEKEEKILDTFCKDPYVQALGPEINTELDALPKEMQNLPLENRLKIARANAIANNVDKIMEVSHKIGTEKAYQNQQVKKSQAGLGSSKSQAGVVKDSVVDRVLRGESVTTEEYIENRDAIRAAKRGV